MGAAAGRQAHRRRQAPAGQALRIARKPVLPLELSGVFPIRADVRYRRQYDSWHICDPPFSTRDCPSRGPRGLSRGAFRWCRAWNQSAHHSHTFPVALYSP